MYMCMWQVTDLNMAQVDSAAFMCCSSQFICYWYIKKIYFVSQVE